MTTNYLWTATHQTANGGRSTEAFDRPADYRAFVQENERWLTSTSEPTRTEIEQYAAWIKRNRSKVRNADELLADLRNEWRQAPA